MKFTAGKPVMIMSERDCSGPSIRGASLKRACLGPIRTSGSMLCVQLHGTKIHRKKRKKEQTKLNHFLSAHRNSSLY